MNDIIRYTNETPIVDIINELGYLFYHKHCSWRHTMLDEEIPVIEKAIKQFAEEIGEIQSKSKTWGVVCFGDYVKFKNLHNNDCLSYFDLEEIDKRYIDLSIAKWKKDKKLKQSS